MRHGWFDINVNESLTSGTQTDVALVSPTNWNYGATTNILSARAYVARVILQLSMSVTPVASQLNAMQCRFCLWVLDEQETAPSINTSSDRDQERILGLWTRRVWAGGSTTNPATEYMDLLEADVRSVAKMERDDELVLSMVTTAIDGHSTGTVNVRGMTRALLGTT